MREPLTNEQLEKLNSTEGIIEILCDIPNFTMDMYEELDEDKKALIDYTLSINLVTNSQINLNLRRSMNDNNLALLNQRKLTALSLYYFGKKDENNKYIEYTCPYTGKIYNLEELNYELTKPYKQRNKDKILELEHILAHSSKGGTVLFNCIPSSKEANSRAEKSDLHLLDWFNQSGNKFYDKNRLYNLVNYILSAYSISFKEFKESEIDYLYEFTETVELETDNEELANEKLIQQKIKNKKNMTIEGYIPFLNQLINELNNNGYNITPFINKLKELENNNIFKNIDKYTIVQDTIEKLFKEYSTEENTSYLTYSINIDYIKLVNSINSNNKEEIETILKQRLSTIKYLIDTNNKTMKDYFISLRDIESIDILYINNPTEKDIKSFVDNIKLSLDTKIEIFIDMLSEGKYTSYIDGIPDSNNIFKHDNKIKWDGYESITGLNTSHFWSSNSVDIKIRLEERISKLQNKSNLTNQEKLQLEKLYKSKKAIDNYNFVNIYNIDLRIDKFIDMLSEGKYTSYIDGIPDSNNIFNQQNKTPFEGYESITGLNTSHFWSDNSTDIKIRLEERISKLQNKSNLTNEEKMQLEKLYKAKIAINNYIFSNRYSLNLRIEKFIDMLSEEKYTSYIKGTPDSNNIFKQDNKISFEGYESITGLNTSHFWSSNSVDIKIRLEERISKLQNKSNLTNQEKLQLEKLYKAKIAINNYIFSNRYSLNLRIEKFIDMISEEKYTSYIDGIPDSNNIFKADNKIPFKGYELITGLDTSHFWDKNSTEIILKLNIMIKEIQNKDNLTEAEELKLEKLNKAKLSIYNYNFANKKNSKSKTERFIDMLCEEKYTSYINGKPDSNNIFKADNKIPFKGYESITGLDTSNFWNDNYQKKIIPLLFYNKCYDDKQKKYVDSDIDYSGHNYDNARRNILKYLKVDNINDYINKLDEKDKKTKKVQDLIDLRNSLREKEERLIQYENQLIEENNQLREELNKSTRRVV